MLFSWQFNITNMNPNIYCIEVKENEGGLWKYRRLNVFFLNKQMSIIDI